MYYYLPDDSLARELATTELKKICPERAMALMESPAIIIGLILISVFNKDETQIIKKSSVIKHSLTNGSVLLIIGSLLIGFLASEQQALGIKPFTTDIFKGFLALFLLDMGICLVLQQCTYQNK